MPAKKSDRNDRNAILSVISLVSEGCESEVSIPSLSTKPLTNNIVRGFLLEVRNDVRKHIRYP